MKFHLQDALEVMCMPAITVQFIIAQSLAFVSAIFFTISIIQKTKKRLIFYQVINTALGVASPLLLQTYAAAVSNFTALIRSVLIHIHKDSKVVMYILAIANLSLSLLTNTKGFIGLLPAIAGAEYTIALIYAKDIRQIRIFTLINVVLWAIHDWTVQIYAFAVCNTADAVILTVSLLKQKKETDSAEL